MRQVLMIAPCFSPSSYPPSLRNRLFVLHLESFGWKPLVLSVEPRRMGLPEDPLIERLLPPGLEIVRTRAFSERWTRKIGIGDLTIRSFWHQRAAAERICRERKIDLVFVSGPLFYSFLVPVHLRKKLGIPYVLDYTDPWVEPTKTRTPFYKKRYWANRLAAWLDPIAVRGASGITSVSEGLNDWIRSLYPEHASKMGPEIPFGTEPADFEFVKRLPEGGQYLRKAEGLFQFAYVGVVWKNAAPTFEAILRAVRLLKDERPALYAKTRWHFIGTSYDPHAGPQILPLAERLGIAETVTEIPQRIPYAEALRAMLAADAIVTVGSDAVAYTSSKIFSCILAERPILAVYHEKSSVVTILKSTDAAQTLTFSDRVPVLSLVREIAEVIERISTRPQAKPAIDRKILDRYSAREMTGRLAKVFDRAVRKEGRPDAWV